MENVITMDSEPTHLTIVQALQDLLKDSPQLKSDLEYSLGKAVAAAKSDLSANLYLAIDNLFKGKGWPTTTDAYFDYLNMYVRLVPNEENDPEYPNAWKSDGTKNGYNQKVFDLLCQFYWLVDQELKGGGNMQTKYEDFSEWLVAFAVAWGSFLDTEASLTEESLQSFIADPMYNMPLYLKNKDKWRTFNEFFYREFNDSVASTGITPLRPIADPQNNQTVVAPADCTFEARYAIDGAGNVTSMSGDPVQLKLKHTHAIGTVNELLDGSIFAEDFYNGTFVHYFLSPFDYHRFHTSVSGEVLEIKDIQGNVFLNVVMTEDGQWDAPDGAEDGYEFNQARGLIIIDAGDNIGKVAILPIGMAQVSGVDMYIDALSGKHVVKGEEFGKFKFGGSDIILLFEKASSAYFFEKNPEHVPIHFQYGQTVAYLS